jgi:hypothetical protein
MSTPEVEQATVKYPLPVVKALVSPQLAIGHEGQIEHDTAEQHGQSSFIGSTKQGLAEHMDHDIGEQAEAYQPLTPFLAAPHEGHGEHDEHSNSIEHDGSPVG